MVNSKLTPQQAMQLAIDEARGGWGKVAPNPLVGCVILNSENELIGKGHHEFYGGPHAEVNAIKNLKPDQLKDAHVYVTLEPCSHQGKTPPCAPMLAELPIRSVTYGLKDPNPKVDGKGLEILKNSGKEIYYLNEFESVIKELTEVFLKNTLKQKPFVAMKVAVTSQGYLSTSDVEPWITNAFSRKYVHYLRAGYDAILVGINTILTDNPQLNVRLEGINKNNKVIVLDPNNKLTKDKKIFSTHQESDIIHINKKFQLKELLNDLYKKGICSIFIEGGAFTIKEFLKEDLIDRAYIFESTKTFKTTTDLPHLDHFKIINNLKNVSRIELDGDIFTTGRLFH